MQMIYRVFELLAIPVGEFQVISALGDLVAIDHAKTISRIQAAGVLGEFSYDLAFPDSTDNGRMRVIYAPNGRGKTNLLRGIASMLTPTPEALQTLIDIPITSLKIDFYSGGWAQLVRDRAELGSFEISVCLAPEGPIQTVHIDPADFAGRLYRRVWDERKEYVQFAKSMAELSRGAVYIGDDRLALQMDDGHDSLRSDTGRLASRRRGAVSSLLQTVERMLTRAAIGGLSRGGSEAGVYEQITQTTLQGKTALTTTGAREALEQQIDRLLSAGSPLQEYGLLNLRQVRNVATQIRNTRANSRQLPVIHQILEPYFESLEDQIEAMTTVHNLIDTYVTGVNKFLDRKSLRFTAADGISLVDRHGEPLDPESLSSGERHLIVLLSRAVLATADESLLLIDEPEISLGIEWQRDLLPELLRCSRSSNVQFVVASHSLQVMNAVARETIIQPSEKA
ncbi:MULTISPECIES: AAA family ATPase [unclassified Arthrobacter]|uniref:AAA family ATPase n=1 Tax=unclassified Arthrobacter TaxID=235627 RepID=UPI001E35B53C|nr:MULTISPECIES: AAA family ATPase [unclassified Arthrobacter]MCC9144116.1 ATP-binding protein [Arthrobacter sp. zg-Y919]MDK1275341.1 AAA family ATPase [Arthrobacter sp. zg.Y919]WIB03269.1 AAA family ATPase [Arthrobacter sp. zg-Y919]